jgi:diguanylate cyclase (GGDEF)-like protein/PAS domain S-box-containing protein
LTKREASIIIIVASSPNLCTMDKDILHSAISDQVPALIVAYNINTGEYIYVNNAVKKILGYTPEDFLKGGLEFATSLVHPDDAARIMGENQKALTEANSRPAGDEEPIVSFEYRMKHKNGNWRWIHSDGSVLQRDGDGKVEVVMNVSLDITGHKSKDQELETIKEELEQRVNERTAALSASEEQYRSLIEAVEDYAIFRLDTKGNVATWNAGIEHIMGYPEAEVLGKPFSAFFTPQDRERGLPQKELEQAKTEGTAMHEGIRVRKDGTTFYAIGTVTPIYGTDGKLQGFSKIMRDITELKEAEETIRFQASRDSLTGLANRKALDDHFESALSMAVRKRHKLAVMFLDLDRFKTINDTLGHGIGDLILKEVGHRLQQSVRQVDTVARLGGDEFIILLNEIYSAQDAVRVAEKILNAFKPVMRVQDQSLHVSTSIGIALFPSDGQDIYTLLKNADTALYRAKDAGRNRYQFYNYSMNLQSVARLSLEQDLRTAVEKGELNVVYQPFINIRNGHIAGVEALVRWQHPKLGPLLPYDFIPLAEETGMILPIGNWILRTVCQEGKQLQEAGFNLQMTVNLSARQFAETGLVDTISDTLFETGLEARFLELEITESVAMENINRTSSKLNDLKQQGISIAIDDFGTGYSSLSYLKRFPVHKLKVDKSFVKHAITDPQDSAIIRAIISMGHSLGLKVCAEGVEEPQQQALLKSMGCDLAQGYLISKPMPPDQLVEWLKNR